MNDSTSNEINLGAGAQAHQVAAGSNISQTYIAQQIVNQAAPPSTVAQPGEFVAPFQAPTDWLSYVPRKAHEQEIETTLVAHGTLPPRFVIYGMGGLGKSTLVAHIANRLRRYFDGGVLWVNLETDELFAKFDQWAELYTNNHKALSAIEGLDARAERLRRIFQEYAPRKKILAIFDSVIDDSDDANLRILLSAFSDHAILVTSRTSQLASFSDAHKIDLAALKQNETWENFAWELLSRVLGANDARLHNARDKVIELGGIVEFLPMALDLAARQFQDNPDWTLDYLLRLVRDELRQLDLLFYGGDKSSRAMRASIQTSYKRLSADEQKFFDALGVFAGTDFDGAAAAFVCQTTGEVTQKRLHKLKRLSLLQANPTSETYKQQMLGAGREPARFKLHSLLRTFAREQLHAANVENESSLRMAAYYCDIARENGNKLHQAGSEHALAILDAEVSNIFAGEKWARENETREARELTRDYIYRGKSGAMVPYFSLRANWAEWIEWSEYALAVCEKLNDERAAGAIAGNLGLVHADKGEWDTAIELYQKSLETNERVGDVHGMAQTFGNLGNMYTQKGEWDRAIEFYQKSLAIKEHLGDAHGMVQTYMGLGSVYADKGEWDKAIEFYQKSLAIIEHLGDAHGMAQTYMGLGSVYADKGEWDKAIEFYQKSLAVKEHLGDVHGMAQTFGNLGNVYLQKGEWDKAIAFYQKSLETTEKIGDVVTSANNYWGLGIVYEVEGEIKRAFDFCNRAMDIWIKLQSPHAETYRADLEELKKKLPPGE